MLGNIPAPNYQARKQRSMLEAFASQVQRGEMDKARLQADLGHVTMHTARTAAVAFEKLFSENKGHHTIQHLTSLCILSFQHTIWHFAPRRRWFGRLPSRACGCCLLMPAGLWRWIVFLSEHEVWDVGVKGIPYTAFRLRRCSLQLVISMFRRCIPLAVHVLAQRLRRSE